MYKIGTEENCINDCELCDVVFCKILDGEEVAGDIHDEYINLLDELSYLSKRLYELEKFREAMSISDHSISAHIEATKGHLNCLMKRLVEVV